MDRQEFIRQGREIQQSESKHHTAKISLSMIPYGTTAYESFTALVKPLHEERKNEWLNLLMSDLIRRQEKGEIDLDELSRNEEFVTIVTKASILAQQNHQEEKIHAFKAILINSIDWLGQGKSIFDWADRFLRIVDEISPLHIMILDVFQDPKAKEQELGKDLSSYTKMSSHTLFCELYPNLKDRSSLIKQCWRDLDRYGFVENDNMMVGTHGSGNYQKLTTDFGDKFLNMITSEEQ